MIEAGANPDAPNYWGVTPRRWGKIKDSKCFDDVAFRDTPLPPARIQNAEHLADHFYPSFKIPNREERESIQIGQAVDLYVYGPKSDSKQDAVKVRITAVEGTGPNVRYTATVETPIESTHLAVGTTVLQLTPENIASEYVAQREKNAGLRRRTT